MQRRRTAEDELNMRKVFREGDLISVSAAADTTPRVVQCSVVQLSAYTVGIAVYSTDGRSAAWLRLSPSRAEGLVVFQEMTGLAQWLGDGVRACLNGTHQLLIPFKTA